MSQKDGGAPIARVTASVHRPPLREGDPAPYAGADSFLFVWLKVELADGRAGHGFTGRFLAAEVAHFLNGALGDALLNRDPVTETGLSDQMMRRFNPRAMTGVVVSALSALDVALHDLRAQAAGVNVSALLGGVRSEAPVHVTCGMPHLDIDALIEATAREVEAGAAGVKMLAGAKGRSVEEDAARVRAVRDAIGPDADLIVDANCAFDLDTALALARLMADCDLAWFEEPIRRNDVRGLAILQTENLCPIGAGQMEQSDERFGSLAEQAGVSVLQPNVVFAGGFSAAVRAAAIGRAAGCAISPAGGWDFLNLLFMCGTQPDGAVEVHRGQDRMARLILGEPLTLEGGKLPAPIVPGLGFTVNEEALRHAQA